MSNEQRRREGQAAAKLAYEEGNGLVALCLVVERAVELEERIEQLEEALEKIQFRSWSNIRDVQGLRRQLKDINNIAVAALSREPSEARYARHEVCHHGHTYICKCEKCVEENCWAGEAPEKEE